MYKNNILEEAETVEIKNIQSCRWMLTINNPNETDDQMAEYLQGLEHFRYTAFQREKFNKEGIIHFHIFIIFSKPKQFLTIKNYFPTAYIEQANGTNSQCRDYCTKAYSRVSGPYEIGVYSKNV